MDRFIEKQKGKFENILKIPKKYSSEFRSLIRNFSTDFIQIKQIWENYILHKKSIQILNLKIRQEIKRGEKKKLKIIPK